MTDFTEKYTTDKEQKLLLRKINDLIYRAEKEYTVLYSAFLDPAQQTLLGKVKEFDGLLRMTGGYDDAERRMCRVCCHEYSQDDGAPIVLFTVRATQKDAVLSHRDVLGSLMGLGLRREMIGDILPNGNTPQFFCHASAAEFIELNLNKVGRCSVVLSRADSASLPQPEYDIKSINISAMRLDCITAEAFGMSRTKAAEAIRKGLVAVNWLECTEPSAEISPDDKISLRGKGKMEVGKVTGTSKKGRLFVEIRIRR